SVHVTTTPGAEVWIEGERAGMAPLAAVQVPIGTREVVVKDPNGGEVRRAVEVKYGDTTEVALALPQRGSGDGSQSAPRLAPLSQYQPKYTPNFQLPTPKQHVAAATMCLGSWELAVGS